MQIHCVLSTAILALAGGAVAAGLPYDDTANAKADVEQALATAGAAKRPGLVIFGAKWGGDCRAPGGPLKRTRKTGLVARGFVGVKIKLGDFHCDPGGAGAAV